MGREREKERKGESRNAVETVIVYGEDGGGSIGERAEVDANER